MYETEELRGQTVVVVGGSGGIGYSIAQCAAQCGAKVAAISRSGRAPAKTKGLIADVYDHDALASALNSVGDIDHLIHTVGSRLGSTPIASLGESVLESAFETKLFSAIHLIRHALPHLAPAASITLTSGQVSRKYGSGSFVKGTINAAMESLGRHLAKELAPRRVNVVSPGVVDTDLWGEPGSASRNAMAAKCASNLPVGRIGDPDELAQAYLFLMTNTFITGSVFDVDGGGLL